MSPTLTVPAGTKKYWGTAVSSMVTSSSIDSTNHTITATLKKLESGQLVTTWGEGYFLPVDFGSPATGVTSVEVGLVPSQGSGFVTLDSDHDGVFKLDTSYGEAGHRQILRVIQHGIKGDFSTDYTIIPTYADA